MAMETRSISRKSPLTGEMNTRVMQIDMADFNRWKNGTLIQEAMPYLTDEEREFLITGCTPEDWDKLWGRLADPGYERR